MGHAFAHQVTLETVSCRKCGVLFAMPESLLDQFRRSGDSFWCPAGHVQHFTESEVDRLRALLEKANRSNTELANDYQCAVVRATRAERENRRLLNRARTGACPCCNRTFQNLARHMSVKHKAQPHEAVSDSRLE